MYSFSVIEDVWKYLDQIPKFQSKGNVAVNFSLDNIRNFCAHMGNPQNDFAAVHVGGTNGKGTTCYLLEHIYSEAGYKTGIFTSPHLLRYNERIKVNGKEIADEEVLVFFNKYKSQIEDHQLSYFEISAALAFWFFSKQEIELAFIEVGLGGRLDATNILNPEVSIITSVGLDHQQVLGNTEAEIAHEKAGIIKPNTPTVVGNVSAEVSKVIAKEAADKEAEVFFTEVLNPQWKSGTVLLDDGSVEIETSLLEEVNKWNIACIWKSIEWLQPKFPLEEMQWKQAIKKFSGAPGRFEQLHKKLNWYFSGAHNAQALRSSLHTLEQIHSLSDTILVFSMMKDKVNAFNFTNLSEFKKVYFIDQKGDRAATFEDISSQINVERLTETNKENILKELKTEVVIFMGSLYFYPTIKRWIANVS